MYAHMFVNTQNQNGRLIGQAELRPRFLPYSCEFLSSTTRTRSSGRLQQPARPSRVNGSISRCVVSGVISSGCRAMNKLFSSLTSTWAKQVMHDNLSSGNLRVLSSCCARVTCCISLIIYLLPRQSWCTNDSSAHVWQEAITERANA